MTDDRAAATRRLLFWLRVPYVADAGLVVIGVWLLVDGQGVGGWVLLFALLRAVVGTVALVVIAPRMMRALPSDGADGTGGDGDGDQGASTAER